MSNNSLLLPPQKVTAGTTDPRGAANLKAEQQVQTTMKLTGKSGGRRRHSKKSGGAGTIPVAPLAGAAVTPQASAANLQIQQLHANAAAQSEYDNMAKKGGSWPKWSCLSGGLKRSSKRSSKRTSKRTKRTKRTNKSRKRRH